ncbi:MAG: hypothetical protein QOG04_897 [Actinomycetota bacterium]|jgi:GAF domain-containing protein|nr:hypothetical protein [Actinomycetota bacterium]
MSALSDILAHEQSLDAAIQSVTDLAARALPGVDGVGLTLIEGVGPGRSAAEGKVKSVAGRTNGPVTVRTATHSAPWVLTVDEDQYATGEGPCLQAIIDGQMHVVPKSSEDMVYPEFSRLAHDQGAESTAAMPLRAGDQVIGAMNLYSKSEGAFDDENLALAQTFAAHVAAALTNIEAYGKAVDLAKNLQVAMDSRAVIEQAKGMIMLQRRCTADEAFQTLVAASQARNKKLHSIAEEVVEGATLETQ